MGSTTGTLSNGLRVRPLMAQDAGQLRELRNLEEVRIWFNDMRPVSREAQARWLAGYFANGRDQMWSAIDSAEHLVGVASLYHIDEPLRRAEFGRLMVDPRRSEFRGTGRLLTAHVLSHALSRGLSDIYLQVKRDNDRARRIYVQLGFAVDPDQGSDVQELRMSWRGFPPPITPEA